MPPTTSFMARDHGAIGDGRSLDTAAIQRAIDACAAAGGGRVRLAGGDFLTGTLRLKSGVMLHLARDTRLLGSPYIAHYAAACGRMLYNDVPPGMLDDCLIHAEGAEHCGLEGSGIVDGQGVHGRHFPNPGDPQQRRPLLLRCVDCRHLTLSRVTLRAPASWTTAFISCHDVRITGVTIDSQGCANGDGLDFDGCDRVAVSRCVLTTGDDAICLQTSRPDRPCTDVTISECTLSSFWAAIRIGLLSCGDIRRVTVRDCRFHHCQEGLKIQACEGGTLADMEFADLAMEEVRRPLYLTAHPFRFSVLAAGEPPPGAIRDLSFRKIRARTAPAADPAEDLHSGCAIDALSGSAIERLRFEDVELSLPGADAPPGRAVPTLAGKRPEFFQYGGALPASCLYLRQVRGISFTRLNLATANPDRRPLVVCDGVTDATRDGGPMKSDGSQ